MFFYSRSNADEVSSIGGTVVSTPSEAARDVEVVVTMLADPASLPATTLLLREALKARGAAMIDAPVFGSKNDAEAAQIGFIVGADRAVFDSVIDVFECMGKPFYVGVNGMGIYAKLVVNLIIAVTLQAMNEGMILAAKAGVDPDIMLQVILSSRARSGIIEMKAPQILKRDFTAFFPLRLMNKDMGLVMDAMHAPGQFAGEGNLLGMYGHGYGRRGLLRNNQAS